MSGERQRLLIVDDQPANVRVMAEALRDQYELYFATSGAKALEIAAASGIELVLLDVVMPDLDGFEVCRRLKSDERTNKIPVIFVTAREEISDEARGFDVGGVDYITKPVQPLIVRARVRTHLELKQARDLLESLASLDGLTGIANRRRFDACLQHEWQRCARDRSPLSLALVDVDFFKSYNDTHGHARGDDCLRTVARALASITRRPSDLAARYGGEEFGLIFPETDTPSMHLLIRAALTAVRQTDITVSIGVITIIPSHDVNPSSALQAADELLYTAKEEGRDQAWHLDAASNERERLL
jgi:diguanylate cyclase (GGDEF)-like protein